MTERLTLAESRPLAEAADATQASSGRMLIQIISPGWGSSGYYSSEVLEAAAGDRVFPAGCQMYLDHPTETEQIERPARSVRDLAAVLLEDAKWNGEALVAPARVYGPHRTALSDMAEDIGVSIRAAAMLSDGEAEGRTGRIVEKLLNAESVDFVTKAGRGGRVLQVLEAAREAQAQESRNVGQWIESRLHLALTSIADEMYGDGRLTRDERIALSSAVGDGLGAFTSKLEGAAPALYQRDIWDEPGPADAQVDEDQGGDTPAEESTETPPGEPTESSTSEDDTAPTDPAAAAAEPEAAPASESNPSPEEDTMTETARGPRQVIEAQLAEMRGQVAQMRARERARQVIDEALADAWLTPSAVTRLTGELLESLPIVDDTLDEAALRETATTARDRAEAEVAEALQAAGVGQPRSLGAPTVENAGRGVDLEGRLTGSLQTLGLTESQAKIAAKGR